MESLIIKEVVDSPYYPSVNFDATSGVCELSGESYMEEAFKFFSPLLDWLKKFTKEGSKKITFNFKLTYFNTSSSRLILDILDIMREYKERDGEIEVNWYYDSQDPDMEDEVEDFMIESGIDINLVSF
jgi:hypothetical protein